jgi:hypothetical protein
MYSTILNEKANEKELSQQARDYLCTLRYFEKLHHRYKATKQTGEVFLKIKCSNFTYALSVKGEWLGLMSVPNNQIIQRPIEDILNEKMAISKENIDFSFHIKQ